MSKELTPDNYNEDDFRGKEGFMETKRTITHHPEFTCEHEFIHVSKWYGVVIYCKKCGWRR